MAQTLGVSSPNGHGGNNNVAHFEIKLLGFQQDPDSKMIACVIRILGEENYDHDDVVDVFLIVNIFGQQTQKHLFESVIGWGTEKMADILSPDGYYEQWSMDQHRQENKFQVTFDLYVAYEKKKRPPNRSNPPLLQTSIQSSLP